MVAPAASSVSVPLGSGRGEDRPGPEGVGQPPAGGRPQTVEEVGLGQEEGAAAGGGQPNPGRAQGLEVTEGGVVADDVDDLPGGRTPREGITSTSGCSSATRSQGMVWTVCACAVRTVRPRATTEDSNGPAGSPTSRWSAFADRNTSSRLANPESSIPSIPSTATRVSGTIRPLAGTDRSDRVFAGTMDRRDAPRPRRP